MHVLLLNFRRCLYISSRLLELIYLNRFIYYLSMEFWWLSLSSHLPHFVIIYQLAESVLCLTVQVIKRYVNGYWFQYWSLMYAVNLLPAGFLVADHNPLSPVAQIFFHLTYCLLFFFFSVDISLIVLKGILEDLIWCFQPDGEAIHCSLTPPP